VEKTSHILLIAKGKNDERAPDGGRYAPFSRQTKQNTIINTAVCYFTLHTSDNEILINSRRLIKTLRLIKNVKQKHRKRDKRTMRQIRSELGRLQIRPDTFFH
jgi:hypothetical protein